MPPAAGPCADGYEEKTGDCPGFGEIDGVGGGTTDYSAAGCAAECSARSTCTSYEYSPTQGKCALNTCDESELGAAYEDYNLCWKLPVLDVAWQRGMSPASQSMTAGVNDILKFSWTGDHDVYKMASATHLETCDFTGAVPVGETSPVLYTLASLPQVRIARCRQYRAPLCSRCVPAVRGAVLLLPKDWPLPIRPKAHRRALGAAALGAVALGAAGTIDAAMLVHRRCGVQDQQYADQQRTILSLDQRQRRYCRPLVRRRVGRQPKVDL